MPFLKKFPTSSAGSDSGSGSGNTWLNPNRIFATDGLYATSAYWIGSKSTSGLLKGSAFGYNLPSSAIIDGIQVDIIGTGYNRIGQTFIGIGVGAKTAIKNTPIITNGAAGGPTDLWGRTDWTPADINNAAFYASWEAMASSTPDAATASIDSITLTVYYHLGGSTTPADVPTREIYKVRNQRGEYIGNLPQPTEPFKLAQDINSVGSQVTIRVPVSGDTSGEPTENYTVEDGSQDYTTEDGLQAYTTEGAVPIMSAAFQGIETLIKNGNTVEVWLYNYFYPNGKRMYIGKIRRWEADFGGETDAVDIVLYYTGYDLDNYIARAAPFTYTNDQLQNVWNSYDNINSGSVGGGWYIFGQSFKVGAGVTNLGSITVKLYGASNISINVYDQLSGNLLGSVTRYCNNLGVGSYTAPTDFLFAFPSLINVTPGQLLFFEVRPVPGDSINIFYQNTNAYADGTASTSTYAGGSGGGAWVAITGDLYFITGSGTPSTTATFTSKDPTTEMLAPLITDYNLQGGSQQWSASTIDATGLSLTYTFKVQTLYEALQAVLSLAPNGFYYYIDMGTQTIYFKNQSTVADFIFIKGVHLNNFKLATTTESSINKIPFTGGETSPGVNLYKLYQSQQSIQAFGPLLDRRSDNRVTLAPTADAIGNSAIAQLAGEQFQTTITIVHNERLDITLLVPGKVIGLRGYGTFVDNILAQIVRREWIAEAVVLTLGILPKRLNSEYEKTLRELIAVQTQDNPSTPS